MTIRPATDPARWDTFLATQTYRPFLQSWTMGEVYRDIGQEPIRLVAEENGTVVGICLGVYVPARRGKHIAVQYGPVARSHEISRALLAELRTLACTQGCSFLRVSPFIEASDATVWTKTLSETQLSPIAAPLHLLAEHVWYLPLTDGDQWKHQAPGTKHQRTEEDILSQMRKTARNLIRRAEKDGVTIEASNNPVRDVEEFIRLHDETRKRHKFTPYTNSFFRAQVKHFTPRNECTVYLAKYQDQVIAASIHMHAFGETSYHHGASDSRHNKVPSSYLLQWTAIKDALKRGDHVYNFWGIAPMQKSADGELTISDKKHPFAGVTLFKTGFGGALLDLAACTDIPLSGSYRLTRLFELLRKWKRGF